MMSEEQSQQFIDLFNEIEQHLQKNSQNNHYQSFQNLIDEFRHKNSIIDFYYEELAHIKQVRNVLVHNHEFYAVPNEKSLTTIKNIKEMLLSPPTVISLFADEVMSARQNEQIMQIIKIMNERGYTQVPVLNENKEVIDMLTTNTITRWLGSQEIAGDEYILKRTTTVAETLKYGEERLIYKFVAADLNIAEVVKIFNRVQKSDKKLEGILITENGRNNEELLGIITKWDITKIYEAMEKNG